jgi:DNA-directed RNA polymerase specialized sigma24 family protein
MKQRFGTYSLEEVEAILDGWEELQELRHKAWIHVRVMDVERTVRRLPRVYREAILLCGMIGLTTRTAGKLVGVSHTAMRKRYMRGLDVLVIKLNGGKP